MSVAGDNPGAGAASGPDGNPGAATERYNLAELQRCIAFSFGAGELSKLAEGFGVFVDRDAGAEKGARALVKAMDARHQLDVLMQSLRQAKPLVEWPEPQRQAPSPEVLPAAWAGEPAPPPPSPDAGASAAEATAAPPPPLAAKPAAAAKPTAPAAQPLADPYADMEAAEPSRAFPRWTPWAAIFAGGLVLGGVATWWLARDREEPSATPQGVDGPGLASLAAEQMRQTVTLVAKACDAPTSGDSARNVLSEAFRRCATPTIRPGVDLTPPLPTRKPAPQPEPLQPLGARPLPKGPPNAACLDSCHREHAECKKSECGQEPESSKQYADYQRCLNVCLTKYSRCRMRCR